MKNKLNVILVKVQLNFKIHLPTHGLNHSTLCQPIQSYSCEKSVPLQAQFDLNAVPSMPNMAVLQT